MVEVDSPTAFELAEIWLIHLEAAACRAKRIDCFTDGITEAMLVDRSEWLERAFRGQQADTTWIMRLARLSEQIAEHRSHGDDIYSDVNFVYAVDPFDPRYRTLYELIELS